MGAHLDLWHQPNLTRLLLFRKLNVLAINVISTLSGYSWKGNGLGNITKQLRSDMCVS